MPLYSASKRSDTPESSFEDLPTATLARYLEETGSGLQKHYTSNPSTVATESHRATESSGIQHGYHVPGHQTDPTSAPSEVGDPKSIPSDESDYGSSTNRLPACDSRTYSEPDSDPIEDLRTPLPAEGFRGIGSRFKYDRELKEFHHPVNDEEGQAIVNRVAHTNAELHDALNNGAQQMKYHGRPYQVSAQSQRPTDPTDENHIVGIDGHQDGPEDLQSAGAQQQRPNSVERADKMRFCSWISCFWS